MHKIKLYFLRHPMGASGAIWLLYLKVLTQRNFVIVAEFHRTNVSFTLSHTFGSLRSNIYDLSLAPWKACSWACVFQRGWVTLVRISGRSGPRPPTSISIRKLDWLPFHVVSKYRQYVLSFRHKACMWWTDGRTDRQTHSQNYDPRFSGTSALWRCALQLNSQFLFLLLFSMCKSTTLVGTKHHSQV